VELAGRDRRRYSGEMRILLAVLVVLAARPVAADPAPAFTAEVIGQGRPVILIPGLGCPASVWEATARHLADDHEVHVLALAGFAGNPAIDRPIPSATRDDVIRYIRNRRLDHPVIVGHSMGGFIALWIAEAAPDLVGPVVVVDSGPTYGGGDPDILPYARAKRAAYKAMKPAAFDTTIRYRYGSMFSQPKKYDAIIAAVTRSDQKAFADALYELYTVDLQPRLSTISIPVLSVLADGASVARVRRQMTPVKDHTVVVLPTRHFVMQDDFAGFSRAIDTFLATHPAT